MVKNIHKWLAHCFPNVPFVIDCLESLSDLDKTFSFEQMIVICDDRELYRQEFWQVMADEEKEQYKYYLVVKRFRTQPITLRQILSRMTIDKHFKKQVNKTDDHRFLEGFIQESSILYRCDFGS